MDSTFLRMLGVKQTSVKFLHCMIYPVFFKLHSKSFGMDPSAPIIIGTINVSSSHIQAIPNCSSE